MADAQPMPGAPGSITIVDPGSALHDSPDPRPGARVKRTRAETTLPPIDEGAPPTQYGTGVATYTVNEDPHAPQEEGEFVEAPQSPKTDVQRLLDARHRRRRLGRHMAQDQIEEDLAEVKKFLALSPADREAYLSIYEYDGSSENLVEGLAKASSLALRVGLAYTVKPKDYDLASMALDMPEVKDSLATIWDCVDVTEYEEMKGLKMAAAVGHIGDTLLGAAMKLYQSVAKAAELRQRQEEMAARRAAGTQSVFDLNHGHTPPAGASTPEAPPPPGGTVVQSI